MFILRKNETEQNHPFFRNGAPSVSFLLAPILDCSVLMASEGLQYCIWIPKRDRQVNSLAALDHLKSSILSIL